MIARLVLPGLLMACLCAGQYSANPNIGEQCIAVVPLQGKGTVADPIRPLYTPASAKRDPKGITGFTWRLTDDKKSALVFYTASDKSAFREIVADSRVKAFIKGKDKRADVERGVRQFVKDFSLEDQHGLRKGQAK